MEILETLTALRDRVLADLQDCPYPSVRADAVIPLLARCPRSGSTPLVESVDLRDSAGVSSFYVKDERSRMGMGSFKALGAAYVIARDAEAGEARGRTYVTASAGNHGLSVAAGAQAFGAEAIIYLSETVPESFADKLRCFGAEVRREGAFYEASMAAASTAAAQNGWALLSDSSWADYYDRPLVLMEGYTVLMEEVVAEIPQPPTHIFLQAGVGGLAAACAAYARFAWGEAPQITVVEPIAAPALFGSMKAGAARFTDGPVSAMGRLDCKEPSLIALKGLARDANHFVLISEQEGQHGAEACAAAGLPSTPSGAAGVSGALAVAAREGGPNMPADARILTILSEGPDV
ncbi:MAG: pyridoxal-phosphate dependent enzyme [Pseudomonadota bacterium]